MFCNSNFSSCIWNFSSSSFFFSAAATAAGLADAATPAATTTAAAAADHPRGSIDSHFFSVAKNEDTAMSVSSVGSFSSIGAFLQRHAERLRMRKVVVIVPRSVAEAVSVICRSTVPEQ